MEADLAYPRCPSRTRVVARKAPTRTIRELKVAKDAAAAASTNKQLVQAVGLRCLCPAVLKVRAASRRWTQVTSLPSVPVEIRKWFTRLRNLRVEDLTSMARLICSPLIIKKK